MEITALQVKKIQAYDTHELHEAHAPQPGDRLCVYGTLRRRVDAAHIRADALYGMEFTGFVRIPRVAMFATEMSGFPFAVVTHDESHSILAESYSFSDSPAEIMRAMSTLDSIEGAPSFYHRTRVRDADGQDYWLYCVHDEMVGSEGMLPSGDWADIVNSRGVRYVR